VITYEWLYALAGAAFALWALLSLHERRWGNAGFWALLAASFLLGSHVSDFMNGLLVLAMVAIAGGGGLTRSDPATTTPAAPRPARRGWLPWRRRQSMLCA